MVNKIFFAACVCIVAAQACAIRKYVYTPPTANLLTPDGKGTVRAAVSYSTAGNFKADDTGPKRSNGGELQVVAAVSNKIAVRADYWFKKEKNGSVFTDNGIPESTVFYKKSGGEVSAGFYRLPAGNSKLSYQLFAGLGTGNLTLDQKSIGAGLQSGFHRMKYVKGFFQPALLSVKSPLFSTSLAARFTVADFYNIETDLTDFEEEPLRYIGSKPSFFGDLIFQMDFGFRGLSAVKFHSQFGISKLFTRFGNEAMPLTDDKYDYNKIWLALGVNADMNKLFGSR